MSVVKMMTVACIAIQTNTKRIGRFLSTKDSDNGYRTYRRGQRYRKGCQDRCGKDGDDVKDAAKR
jgi:hypothetical protein